MPTEAAVVLGVVLSSRRDVLLIRRRGESSWLFPGGKIEPGEREADAVVREVAEESGIKCRPQRLLGRRTHPTTQAVIAYWLCDTDADTTGFQGTREIAEARWFSARDALGLLGPRIYEPARALLQSVAGER